MPMRPKRYDMRQGGGVLLPQPRVSGFPRAPGRLMGPGPVVSKPAGTPPERGVYFGPVAGLGFQQFSEIYREVIKGYAHGRLIVGADVVVSAATSGSFVAPFLYVDVQIVGYTNGLPEVLAYGAPGSLMKGVDGTGYPAELSNTNMDAPPVQAEWDDSFGYDEVAILIRTMGNGGQPFGAGWNTNPGDIINVSVNGKLWR